MGPFLVAAWASESPERSAAVAHHGAVLERTGGWSIAHKAPGLCIFVTRSTPVTVRLSRDGHVCVLGDVFDGQGADLPEVLPRPTGRDVRAQARTLLETIWGRYAALFLTDAGRLEAVLRDPTGGLEAVAWRRDGVCWLSSDPGHAAFKAFGPVGGVDWATLGAFASDFTQTTARLALAGAAAPAPGGLLQFTASAPSTTQIWRPSVFAADPIEDFDAAARELRRRIILCVRALARGAGGILAEVSGGLDSSIVAAGLKAASPDHVEWLHHVTYDIGGDERLFARALGAAAGLVITERDKPTFAIDPEEIARTQAGPRPSANALDARYDAMMAEEGGNRGLRTSFTGMAGDGLFFLSGGPDIAVDLVRRRGWGSLFGADLTALARWIRRSVWALGAHAILPGKAVGAELRGPAWLATPAVGAQQPHPWLTDVERLPPAKRRHIDELVHALLFYGRSLRGEAMDLVHPLFSQPVMEHCLRIPVDLLVRGGRDRALAREAFREALPAALIDRRSKGELSPYYSRAFLDGLPKLGPYLLEGRLAEKGLLRRPELSAALDPAYQAERADFAGLLRVVALEGWARRWA